MKTTYEAILIGDKLEWIGERPETSGEARVRVEFETTEPAPTLPAGGDGAALARVLRDIRAQGGITSIEDPVAWQREQRVDRPLPGREP
ncbi:MAG: hypothetical protein QM770_03370 [Tepidisphaeraceae bacterium]